MRVNASEPVASTDFFVTVDTAEVQFHFYICDIPCVLEFCQVIRPLDATLQSPPRILLFQLLIFMSAVNTNLWAIFVGFLHSKWIIEAHSTLDGRM